MNPEDRCSLWQWNFNTESNGSKIKEPRCVRGDFNLFVICSVFIYQGVYARHLLGNASAPTAAQFGQCVEPLAKVALQLAQRFVTVMTTSDDECGCLSVSF